MFMIQKTNGKARQGLLKTRHGILQTPFFMPIATKGAVKTLSSEDVKKLDPGILLSNTYHLLLRPGLEAMKKLGGLHHFMQWDQPILTDSGGYQVFSLSKLNKTTEDGVVFQSHIDGARVNMTPEGSMRMQHAIGSDIWMQFDDVASGQSTRERYEEAMERSLRWARRCKEEHARLDEPHQALLFGIVQGGTHADLRQRSIDGLTQMGFDGYAIGGLSVGESREDTYAMTELIARALPFDRPRYFMGGGMPEEIVAYVQMGVDMFDCVLPTRNARHGSLFVWRQHPATIDWSHYQTPKARSFYDMIHVESEPYQFDESPVDAFCDCETCRTVSRAYLRHLFKVQEMLAFRLATIHNLHFYLTLMRALRVWI